MVPTSEFQVAEQLQGAVPMILEGGSCEKGMESTIVSFEDGRAVLIREGAVTKAQIEAVTGSSLVKKQL